jgi:hypothetical protein
MILAVSFLLALSYFSDSRIVFVCAMSVGALFFISSILQDLKVLPRLNLPSTIANFCGLSYFGGAIPVSVALIVYPEYVQAFRYISFRDYDIEPLCEAALLVLFCCGLLIALSKNIKLTALGRLMSFTEFRSVCPGAFNDTNMGVFISAFVAAIAATLIATGKMSIDFNPAIAEGGALGAWFLIVYALAPAILILASSAFWRNDTSKNLKLIAGVSCLILVGALFLLGRRAIMAAAFSLFISFVVSKKIKLKTSHMVVAALVAAVGFSFVSNKFIELRSVQNSKASAGISALYMQAARSKAVEADDATLALVMRVDLLGELARVVSHYPSDQFHLGAGTVSQVANVVPSAIWPDKADFTYENVLTDEMILRDAALPPSDIASTLVLYSYADWGIFSPILYTLLSIFFVLVVDVIAMMSKSYATYLVGVGMVISYIPQTDRATFSTMLFDIRFLLVFLVLGWVLSLAFGRSSPGPTLKKDARLRPVGL